MSGFHSFCSYFQWLQPTPMIIWQNTMVSNGLLFVQKWDPPKYSALKYQFPFKKGHQFRVTSDCSPSIFLAGEIHISRQTQISYCWLWLWFLATTWHGQIGPGLSRLAAYEVLCIVLKFQHVWLVKTHRPEKDFMAQLGMAIGFA